MRRTALPFMLAASAAAVGLAAGVKVEEDPPTVHPARSGDIKGKVTPGRLIQSLSLVSRVTEKRYQPSSFDRKSGQFAFKGLKGDARYDICLRTTDGRELEGIDLDFLEQRWLRLAAKRRKELGLPPDSDHKFSMDDVKMLVHHVTHMREFMELHRPLYIKGHGKWATMLVELMRTRAHYAGKGRLIWRVELWYWEYRHGGWERVLNQERLLRRQRAAPSAWRKTNVEWFPQLSASINEEGFCPAVEFKIPDKPDIRRGRLPDTQPYQKIETFVLGLEVEPEGHVKGRPVTFNYEAGDKKNREGASGKQE